MSCSDVDNILNCYLKQNDINLINIIYAYAQCEECGLLFDDCECKNCRSCKRFGEVYVCEGCDEFFCDGWCEEEFSCGYCSDRFCGMCNLKNNYCSDCDITWCEFCCSDNDFMKDKCPDCDEPYSTD